MHEDSLDSVLCDWIILGKLCDCRLGEWTQNEEIKKTYLKLAIEGTPLVFIFTDFNFLGSSSMSIDQKFDDKINQNCVESIEVQWSLQKNLIIGQKIFHSCNKEDSSCCGFLKSMRIRARER